MKKNTVSILNIGTELVMGNTLNTHAQYMSKRLQEIGYVVQSHMTCNDDINTIVQALDFLKQSTNFIMITGGLGPTIDDLTREAVSEYLKLPLVENLDAKRKLNARFKQYNYQLTTNNYRQTYFPQNSKILVNDFGSADGFLIETSQITIVVLPGPPKEMKHVLNDRLVPLLLKETQMITKEITLYGLGESSVDEKVSDLIINDNNITSGIYAEDGCITLRLSTIDRYKESGIQRLLPLYNQIVDRLNTYIFSVSGLNLEEELVETLSAKQLTISFAESCTGGSLAKALTSVSGSSHVFNSSFITYSNDQKKEILNVKEETLKTFGAVSKETAKEMLLGLKDKTNADICISVTGIAGPSGGTDDKPVGLVYIGLYSGTKIQVKKYLFKYDRERNRRHTTLTALKWALECAKSI